MLGAITNFQHKNLVVAEGNELEHLDYILSVTLCSLAFDLECAEILFSTNCF